MKNYTRTIMAVLVLVLISISCQKEEQQFAIDQTPDKNYVNKDKTLNADAIAQTVVDYLSHPSNRKATLALLEENRQGKALEDILNKNSIQPGTENLHRIVQCSRQLNNTAKEHGVIEIPELWLHKPSSKINASEILVAFPPEGNEDKWEQIKAYTLNKEIVYLDPHKAPDRPVVVIETHGREALKLKVKLMNKHLQKLGAQKIDHSRTKKRTGLETTKLERIQLNDDKEPWIKGAAEIFAVTSGIRDQQDHKEPQISIIAMPYLDYENENYTPNQVMLFWDDYDYQAANIQFFEEDSNYNYKELVSILTNGVFQIAGLYTSQPWVSVLGEMASKIIEAMPDEWYTDNDDYVDSFYTIMKDKSYENYKGAANNAEVTFSPFVIPEN